MNQLRYANPWLLVHATQISWVEIIKSFLGPDYYYLLQSEDCMLESYLLLANCALMTSIQASRVGVGD